MVAGSERIILGGFEWVGACGCHEDRPFDRSQGPSAGGVRQLRASPIATNGPTYPAAPCGGVVSLRWNSMTTDCET